MGLRPSRARAAQGAVTTPRIGLAQPLPPFCDVGNWVAKRRKTCGHECGYDSGHDCGHEHHLKRTVRQKHTGTAL